MTRQDVWRDWFRSLAYQPVDGEWQPAPYWYRPLGPYKGTQFPIRKDHIFGKWLVIDECLMRDGSYQVRLCEDVDAAHEMKDPDAWALWPNRKKLAQWHNEPLKRSQRLAQMRATSCTVAAQHVRDNSYLAKAALSLQAMIVSDPTDQHIVGRLDWSPTGQVWLDGRRWVKIPAPTGGLTA